MEPKDLVIHDDKIEYTNYEIKELVNRIEAGNRQRSGFSKNTSAFGIVGKFVRK